MANMENMEKPEMAENAQEATSLQDLASAFDFAAYHSQLDMMRGDYVCPVCENTGWIFDDVRNFATACSCSTVRTALGRLRRQGLDQAARQKTFDSFVPTEPWQQQMLTVALAYAQQAKPGWLFLGGQSGCGKTHLGTAAAVSLALRGRNLLYMPWTQVTSQLKALSLDERRSALMQEYIDAQVLYIDDLFKHEPTESDKRIAFELISARSARDDRPTILSCERTLLELCDVDEALAGRIAEGCSGRFFVNIARDRRKNHRFAGMW